MTTYNAENFLKTQIDSILEQLESEDEIIIVDDFSSDSTELIVKDYNDVRIRFFKN
jgi:glycosyltransferase involved in cell wall biosynthesis